MKKDEQFEARAKAKLVRVEPGIEIEGEAMVRFDLLGHARGDPAITIEFYPAEQQLADAMKVMSSWGPYRMIMTGHKFYRLYPDGRPVQPPQTPGIVLTFVCARFEAGDPRGIERLVFLIPDLAIGYDARVRTKRRAGTSVKLLRSTWEITLSGKPLACDVLGRFLPEELRRQPRPHLFTTTIQVPCEAVKEVGLDRIARRLDDILRGLSLAAGQPRDWARVIGFRGQQVVWQGFRDPVNMPRERGIPMLECEKPGVLTPFVSAYSKWIDPLSDRKRRAVRTLIAGLLEATCHRRFPVPFFVLASVLEVFIAGYCGFKTSSYVSRATRKQLWQMFELWQERYLIPRVAEQEAPEFREKAKGSFSQYLQRRLRSRLTKMLANVKNPDKERIIGQFVTRRNKATHEDYEYEPKDWEIIKRMVGLAYEYLVGEIGYEGPRIPWADRNV